MSDTDTNLLDLSALNPVPQQLKLPNGRVVEVKPPEVQHVLKLGFLGQKLVEGAELADDELEKVINGITTELKKIIPELEGVKLTAPQLTSLITMINSMGAPPQSKALADKGITTDASPKAGSSSPTK